MPNISDNDILRVLSKALSTKEATGTPAGPYLHGPGGMFGIAGIDRDIISARVQPIGLASMLPAVPSVYMNPLFGYITGFLAGTGTEPDGVCSEPPAAGRMKTCLQTAQFGRFSRKTRELDIDRVGQLTNRGEMTDLRIVNDPLVNDLGGIFPNLPQQQQMLAGRDVLERMLEVGIEFQNWLCRTLWTGNPQNNTANGGYKEFPGFTTLVGANKVDAETNVTCPALYSDVKDYQYKQVASDVAPTIDRYISELFRILGRNAQGMNFGMVEWVIAMRTDLFYELTAFWPCKYSTDRCTNTAIDRTADLYQMTQLRDDMRNGNYLLVDGVKRPVVLDDCIPEFSSGDTVRVPVGCYSSDIYIIPLTVRSGVPVTFWEYYDYSANPGTMTAVNDGRASNRFWTDGGRYMWTWAEYNWCITHMMKVEPRVVLKTPQLAGRLNNVVYCPLQHSRNANPSDPYFMDGGNTTGRVAPSFYHEWTNRTGQ
jgi:hypothetical protein